MNKKLFLLGIFILLIVAIAVVTLFVGQLPLAVPPHIYPMGTINETGKPFLWEERVLAGVAQRLENAFSDIPYCFEVEDWLGDQHTLQNKLGIGRGAQYQRILLDYESTVEPIIAQWMVEYYDSKDKQREEVVFQRCRPASPELVLAERVGKETFVDAQGFIRGKFAYDFRMFREGKTENGTGHLRTCADVARWLEIYP